MNQAPTMRDVAERAGVSPMTVSRTLREHPKVDPDLRQRVLAAVAELGYRRNDLAAGLRARGQTGLVGLVITNLGNPFYSQLASGVEASVAEHGLQLLLGSSGDDSAAEQAVVDGLISRRVQGLVVVPGATPGEYLAQARTLGAPVVLATARSTTGEDTLPTDVQSGKGSRKPGAILDSVVVDDFGGAREASRRLTLEGHERIAFLGLAHPSWPGSERRRGFLAGLDECGTAVDPALLIEVPAHPDAADVALWRLMSAPHPPTAIFAANNRNTLAACRWVAQTGQPLRIVGFDDIATAPLLAMPVSLITYSPVELGRRAGNLLMRRIHGDASPPHTEVMATHVVHHPGPARR